MIYRNRYRSGLDGTDWLVATIGIGLIALVVFICVVSYGDAQVRSGVVVGKDHSAGYMSYTGTGKYQSATWQPETFTIQIRGNRRDTGEQRVASVSVDQHEYDNVKIGDQWNR